MTFTDVQEWFKSWGLFPYEEDCAPYNKEVIDNGINEPCFNRMIEAAKEKHGKDFASFCSRMIDATDNAFYLQSETWDDIKAAYLMTTEHGKHPFQK